MEYAILRTVCLMLFCNCLGARQNDRFRPSNSLVPVGSLFFEHRLWNVRLVGCSNRGDGLLFTALLKFSWIVFSGLA
jgi:hypothetical protein